MLDKKCRSILIMSSNGWKIILRSNKNEALVVLGSYDTNKGRKSSGWVTRQGTPSRPHTTPPRHIRHSRGTAEFVLVAAGVRHAVTYKAGIILHLVPVYSTTYEYARMHQGRATAGGHVPPQPSTRAHLTSNSSYLSALNSYPQTGLYR